MVHFLIGLSIRFIRMLDLLNNHDFTLCFINFLSWYWPNLCNCTCQMERFGNITRATPLSQCHCLISHITGMLGAMTIPYCVHDSTYSDTLRCLTCHPVPLPACLCELKYTEVPYMSSPLPQPLNGMLCAHGVCPRGWQSINVLCCVSRKATPLPWPWQVHYTIIRGV